MGNNERGQSLVLVTLLLIVLIGILALAIDGGFGYAKRRSAQNAADAAALAGANELCKPGISPEEREVNALLRAQEYALKNGAAIDPDGTIASLNLITATTQITYTTFFAGLIGEPQMHIRASAAAGCFPPGSGEGVLPVAWSCRPPIGGIGTDDCAIEYGSYGDPGPLYIIMDSESLDDDFLCQDPPNSGTPAGALDCDLDNNGLDELLAEGNRSWLDLNGGGGGSSELVDWVEEGFDGDIFIHNWYGGQAGVANDVFQAAHKRIDDIVVIPVFDMFCEGVPELDCPTDYHTGTDTTVASGGASETYFHVISFAGFVITCVDAPPHGPCPGHDLAIEVNPSLHANLKTIEGYFIGGYIPGMGGGPGSGADVATYVIYLIR
jgi:hypothetical protein